MMRDEVYARALLMAGQPGAEQQAVLEVLCDAACSCLETSLRDGMTPEDCREVFITGASLQALAALEDFAETMEFKAGDLTVKKSARADRARELRHQAETMMRPYLKDTFLFAGV